jgi:hypothetical protein
MLAAVRAHGEGLTFADPEVALGAVSMVEAVDSRDWRDATALQPRRTSLVTPADNCLLRDVRLT